MAVETPADTELLPVAEKIRTRASAAAAEADATGRLAPHIVEALAEAGFHRHFVPARWGGAQASFTELSAAVAALAEGCPATAWCASLAAYSARYAAHLPLEGQRDLWQDSPDRFVATALVPAGAAVEVDGGWQISGRWSYVSGAEFADWMLLCGPAPDPLFFAVPAADVTVEETWDSVGMRATGSHTVVADVRVPAHRTFPRADIMAGRNATSTAACHTAPFGAVGGLTFAVPVLGAATGALTAYLAAVGGRPRTPVVEQAVARSAGELDAARLLVDRIAAVLDAGTVTRADAARNARDAALVAELSVAAVVRLVHAAGTAGLSAGAPLQRLWRDVTVAASHVALRFETSAPTFTAALLDTP